MHLTYKYRLLPTKAQHNSLSNALEEQRQLYNAALQERIEAYRRAGKSITKFEQFRAIADIRECFSGPVVMARWTLTRLDDAFKAFFKRAKTLGKAGFPRFRQHRRWRSIGMTDQVRVRNGRLCIWGVGNIKVHLHRPLCGDVKSCVISRDHKGWSVALQVEIADAPVASAQPSIGIDVGLSHFATLSTGEHIANPRIGRKAEKAIRRHQRALSRAKRGSKRREKTRKRLERAYAKIAATRTTFLHQKSAALIKRGGVAVEKLNIKGLARTRLAKSIHDAAWGRFIGYLRYKAEKAGVAFVEVDPRYTSQACSNCGEIKPKALSDRRHICACGINLCRDHNAAINILHRAVVRPGGAKQAVTLACLGNVV